MRALKSLCLVVTVLMIAGCASSSWNSVRTRDTVAAYHQYLRDNPDSPYRTEAEERLAYLRVRKTPTIQGFETFLREHPESAFVSELRDLVEDLYFESSRQANTESGYELFLSLYPRGKFVARASGNLGYVKTVRHDPRREVLEQFVRENPASDFVADANARIELIDLYQRSRIRRVAVRVDVEPTVVQSDRVRKGFMAVIAKSYASLGIEVVPLSPKHDVSEYSDAWIRVDYHEAPAAGVFGGNTLLSHCRVRVYHRELEEPIWDRKFEAPADHVLKGAYGRDKTVFGNSKYRFWEEFFVPLTTWAASSARVQRFEYLDEVQDVDVFEETAAVLLRRGNVDFVNISSPQSSQVVERYRRESDLATWTGVEMFDENRVVIFGNDGVEVLERTELAVVRRARFDVAEIGQIAAISSFDGRTVLAAGNRGVHALRWEDDKVVAHRMLDGAFVGVEVIGGLVYLARKDMLEVANAKHLLRHVTGAKVQLPENFAAHRLHRSGNDLFLFGRNGVTQLDLTQRTRPKVTETLESEVVGQVADLAMSGGRLLLLGTRGFQVAHPEGQPVDAIQVESDRAFDLKGHYAFLVGERTLEVIDLAPYHAASDG